MKEEEAKSKTPVEGKDFMFVNHSTLDDHLSVKIISGDYTSTIYTYGNVKIKEFEKPDGTIEPHLHFVFMIDSTEFPYKTEDLEKDSKFIDFIGSILEEILNSKHVKIGDKENNGEN